MRDSVGSGWSAWASQSKSREALWGSRNRTVNTCCWVWEAQKHSITASPAHHVLPKNRWALLLSRGKAGVSVAIEHGSITFRHSFDKLLRGSNKQLSQQVQTVKFPEFQSMGDFSSCGSNLGYIRELQLRWPFETPLCSAKSGILCGDTRENPSSPPHLDRGPHSPWHLERPVDFKASKADEAWLFLKIDWNANISVETRKGRLVSHLTSRSVCIIQPSLV